MSGLIKSKKVLRNYRTLQKMHTSLWNGHTAEEGVKIRLKEKGYRNRLKSMWNWLKFTNEVSF